MGNKLSPFLKYAFRENFPPLCDFKVKNAKLLRGICK